MAPRKQKRQDESSARPLQAPHAPVAEAIAIGAAAGGLVLGTMQAQGAMPDSQHEISAVRPEDAPRGDDHVATAPVSAHQIVALDGDPVVAHPVAEQSEPLEVIVPATAAPVVDGGVDTVVLANSIPAPLQSQLVTELSEQMTATLVKVMGNAEPGLSPADLGQSLASDIVASAQDIVARLDIGSLLAGTQNLGDSIVTQIDAPGMIADALGATSGIADGVLAEVADLPASILGDTGLAALGELPSSLLGNEGPDGSGGLLSEIFYADGASDSLDIPVLSDIAATLVSELPNGGTGLLGLSYIEASDYQGGHGINALSLL